MVKIDLEKYNFWNFRSPVIPWIGSHGIPLCIIHWPLSTYQISLKSEKLFLDGLTAGTPPSSRSSKIQPEQIKILSSSLRISGHLSAATVNCGGDRLGKVQFSELQKPLDLGSGHTAYRHASVVDLYLHTKFHRNRTNFLLMDVQRTYVRTYWRTDISPSNVVKSTSPTRPKKEVRGGSQVNKQAMYTASKSTNQSTLQSRAHMGPRWYMVLPSDEWW